MCQRGRRLCGAFARARMFQHLAVIVPALSSLSFIWETGDEPRSDRVTLLAILCSLPPIEGAMKTTALRAMLIPLFLTASSFGQEADLPSPVRIDSGVSGHIHPALAVTKK